MALAFGHGSTIIAEWESTYKTLASGTSWKTLPVSEWRPGIEEGWLAQDIVGLAGGRDAPDPRRDLLMVDPVAVVPVDLVSSGYWFRLVFGDPTTTGSSDYTHTFKSGGGTPRSLSIEHGNGSITNGYQQFLGCRGSTMQINFAFGQVEQTMTIGMVGANAQRAASSADASPTAATWTPFTGAVGTATRAGSALARVTGASLNFSNGIEKIMEANRSNAALTEAAPGVTEVTGTVDLRMDAETLLSDSEGSAAVALAFGYSISATQLVEFTVPEAYISRAGLPVRGRAGIQQTFNFRGAYNASEACALKVVLKNQQAAYT